MRAIFDVIIEKHPNIRHRLGHNSPIYLGQSFEIAVREIQDREEAELTNEEKYCVAHLRKSAMSDELKIDGLSMVQRLLKGRKYPRKAQSSYLYLRFIVMKSNLCERCFLFQGLQ